MVLLRHITASSPTYAVHYHSAVYSLRLIGKMIAREYLSTGEDRPENTGRKNS